MDEKTARKYRDSGQIPSQTRMPHTWRTRPAPCAQVWDEVAAALAVHPGLQAKTLFADLQRRYPGCFSDGQLRTMQRRIKVWRATEGPPKEAFFPQIRRESPATATVQVSGPLPLAKKIAVPGASA